MADKKDNKKQKTAANSKEKREFSGVKQKSGSKEPTAETSEAGTGYIPPRLRPDNSENKGSKSKNE